MSEQSKIDSALSRVKQFYYEHWPLCLFCNHLVRPGKGQLAHIIRRSWTSNIYSRYDLQTMKLNLGLSHHSCHDIADNKPHEAILLPRFLEVQFIGWLIDPAWHQEQKLLYDFYNFPDFNELANKNGYHLVNYNHHGEMLHLMIE